MCGIAGIVHRDGASASPDLLKRMTDVLAHRGPDGEGFHIDGPIGLGHRRLAIIDVAGGVQPMASSDRSAWVTYNGEVYNYRELRHELRARGHDFETSSDTEVVLAAYQEWGVDCLRYLRGMFAFGIWDDRRRQLFLARDRVGIKPLVYAVDATGLRFASEIKAILQDPAVPRDLDLEAVEAYFTYLYVPAPRTIFRGIRKLPPASYLLWSPDRGEPEIHTYWDLRMRPRGEVREEAWREGLEALLHESVRLHMVSDVPVGAFLSGGLDSSSVVACMARTSAAPVKTFSIGFDEPSFDELSYARLVAQRYGTEHFEMVVKPDVISVLPRLAWQFDEPFADASAVPTYCVSKITRDHVTVALSGDGGDENFAGYRRYAEALGLHRRMDSLPFSGLKPLLRLIGNALPEGARGRRRLQFLAMAPFDRYHRMMAYQDGESLATLLSSEARLLRTGGEGFTGLAAEAGTDDYLSTLQYLDVRRYLPGDILTKVDRTSMLTSLETRVPFLDHVLMEHVASMPAELKLRGGSGKHVLKEAMRPHLPAEILTRRKMGFGVPLAAWFRRELKDFTYDVLLSARARERGILRPDAMERLFQAHLSGRADWSSQLWSLVCFELWCRTWWDR